MDLALALESLYDEVQPVKFYRDIFPVGSFETRGLYEDGKYNGIAVSVAKGDKHAKRYTITDDLEVIRELADTDDFCLTSPISYAGKTRKSEFARFMYALAIDLDGVDTKKEWDFFIYQTEHGEELNKVFWGLPKPTYLVSSGTGLHIYYVFEKPIPLFKNIVEQLEKLKKRLTWQAWTQGASSLHDNVQYESLFQGFRMVGTITKDGGRCRAFKVGSKVDIDYLNLYVPERYRAQEFTYKSELRLEKAKELYPEWYQSRVVEKRPKQTWTCKKDLYNWWIRRLEEIEQGHRYWYIMSLATYAMKCNVPFEELEQDAYAMVPFMNTKGDLFTEDDVMKALEAYTDSYITYPIHAIENRTGIRIDRNKRNGRRQRVHIEYMNLNKRFKYINGECSLGGRPDKQTIVKEWRINNPNGKKADCIRETGLTKPTVYKWW